MKRIRPFLLCLSVLAAALCLASCRHDDDLDINDILVGVWLLDDYTIESDGSVALMIDHLEFYADGRFYILYEEPDSDSGTYEAGNAYIRFDYVRDGATESLLWEVLSFSDRALSARYTDPQHDLTATVYLTKQGAAD